MSKSELAVRLTATEAARVYAECEATVRGAFAMIAAAEARLNATFAGADTYHAIHVAEYHRGISFTEPDEAIVRVRHDVWRALVERVRRVSRGDPCRAQRR